MRGHELDNFWRQVRWMTEHMLPELPACWRDATSVTGCLGVAAVVAALILSWATSNPIWIAPTLVLALASYLAASAYKRITNPLPSHIVTFRDLSMMVANEGP